MRKDLIFLFSATIAVFIGLYLVAINNREVNTKKVNNNSSVMSDNKRVLILKEVYDNDICKGIEGIKDVKCKIEEKDGRTKYILYIPFVKDDYEAERKLAEILKNKKIFELIKDKNEFKYINEEKEEKVVNKMFASIYLDNNNKKEENIKENTDYKKMLIATFSNIEIKNKRKEELKKILSEINCKTCEIVEEKTDNGFVQLIINVPENKINTLKIKIKNKYNLNPKILN